MIVQFTVYGQPQGKARPRFTKSGHVYTPKATKDYESSIKQSYIAAAKGYTCGDDALSISIMACMQRSKSNKRKHATTKPDIDNIVKAVLDGLNGVAFKDDKQVVSVNATKFYNDCGESPYLEVRIVAYEQ